MAKLILQTVQTQIYGVWSGFALFASYSFGVSRLKWVKDG